MTSFRYNLTPTPRPLDGRLNLLNYFDVLLNIFSSRFLLGFEHIKEGLEKDDVVRDELKPLQEMKREARRSLVPNGGSVSVNDERLCS